jgi:hypothetical protein
MAFHPIAQEIARALNARRAPPPPFVPALVTEQLKRFANVIFQNPGRREIAEGLLVLAIRLDVLGFGGPRDQLLLLAGCGLSAAEIENTLEVRHADEAGAHRLMDLARSTAATQMEKVLSSGRDLPSKGVGVRSGPSPLQRTGPGRPDGHRADEATAPHGRPGTHSGLGTPKPRR